MASLLRRLAPLLIPIIIRQVQKRTGKGGSTGGNSRPTRRR